MKMRVSATNTKFTLICIKAIVASKGNTSPHQYFLRKDVNTSFTYSPDGVLNSRVFMALLMGLSLFRRCVDKCKVYCPDKQNKTHNMVPAQRLALKEQCGYNGENSERDNLLNNF